jgi:hypothetical protein
VKSGAGLGTRSVPRCSAALLRARRPCSGPRAHSRPAPGRTGAWQAGPTIPGPWPRTRSLAAASPGVRLLVCGIQIETLARTLARPTLLARPGVRDAKCLPKEKVHHCWTRPCNGGTTSTPYAAVQPKLPSGFNGISAIFANALGELTTNRDLDSQITCKSLELKLLRSFVNFSVSYR